MLRYYALIKFCVCFCHIHSLSLSTFIWNAQYAQLQCMYIWYSSVYFLLEVLIINIYFRCDFDSFLLFIRFLQCGFRLRIGKSTLSILMRITRELKNIFFKLLSFSLLERSVAHSNSKNANIFLIECSHDALSELVKKCFYWCTHISEL